MISEWIWVTSVTVLKIRFGLQIMPAGKRRAMLMAAFENFLTDMIERRIAPFDAAAARQAADLMSARRSRGRTVELRDAMIAGIVLSCRAALATRNTAHFDDLSVPIINPWIG